MKRPQEKKAKLQLIEVEVFLYMPFDAKFYVPSPMMVCLSDGVALIPHSQREVGPMEDGGTHTHHNNM